MGTHGELIRKRGHYYDLYTKQFRDQMEATFESLDELPEGELALA